MKKLVFPSDWQRVEWHGFTRYNFTFEGCNAFIVEPKYPSGDGRWSWCTVWPEAFVRRVGIEHLLEYGFYHAHVDAFAYRANPDGIRVMKAFHDKLVEMGLSPKANLIGMSWGGFFSLRYAETHPQDVAALYLDAPVCNAASNSNQNIQEQIEQAFGMSREELAVSKLNPLNNVEALLSGGFPMMAELGNCDESVDINENFNKLEARIIELGGSIVAEKRNYWGHHPHGVDDPERLLAFHCNARNV